MVDRQQVLHLWLAAAALDTEVVAWAIHDGAAGPPGGGGPRGAGGAGGRPLAERPYHTGVEALADGWFLLQAPGPIDPAAGNGEIGCEFVFERRVPVDGS